ncbi:MAG: WbqC family protein [Flavobacteriales bacterium]
MNAVDRFVIYDNIEYTKKGWINRNRMLVNGEAAYMTIPLSKAPDDSAVCERYLSDTFSEERAKLLRRIEAAYRKAPYFTNTWPLLQEVLGYAGTDLFGFLHRSITLVAQYLGISTPIVISSSINADHTLKGQERVIAICQAIGATAYLNPPGGMDLYDTNRFNKQDISLYFLIPNDIDYIQFEQPFVPQLSILDVMMFNSSDRIQILLEQYAERSV